MDVIYAIGKGSSWDDNELRYSLRSLEKNYSDLGKVIIVGHVPKWINFHNISWYPCIDPYVGNKDANMINKYLYGTKAVETESFLKMADDYIVLKPLNDKMLEVYPYQEVITEHTEWGNTRWQQRLKRTYEYLKYQDLLPRQLFFNHECHMPYAFNKHLFFSGMLQTNYGEGLGYTINSLFLNQIEIPRKPWEYCCQFISKPMPYRDLVTKAEYGQYLCYHDESLNSDLALLLDNLFPNKSKYESD